MGGDFTLYLLARKKNSDNIIFRTALTEWHDLIRMFCPPLLEAVYAGFPFKLEHVLSESENDLCGNIVLDKEAMSISEYDQPYIAPTFDAPSKWRAIFKKTSIHFFNTANTDFLSSLERNSNNHTQVLAILKKIREYEAHFTRIEAILNVAEANDFEVAVTVSDSY